MAFIKGRLVILAQFGEMKGARFGTGLHQNMLASLLEAKWHLYPVGWRIHTHSAKSPRALRPNIHVCPPHG